MQLSKAFASDGVAVTDRNRAVMRGRNYGGKKTLSVVLYRGTFYSLADRVLQVVTQVDYSAVMKRRRFPCV
jgi:hypothetical protein